MQRRGSSVASGVTAIAIEELGATANCAEDVIIHVV